VSTGRLVGLDVARCLALVGMIATHTLDPFDATGDLALGQELAGGRASALFAVLAGVTTALVAGGTEAVHGERRVEVSVRLAVRAVLVAAVGLALGHLDSGIAVILTYYGLLFLLALPFLGLGARALLGLGTAWALLAPVLSHLLRPRLPERGFDSPTFTQLVDDPAGMLGELALTGYYPVVPWLAYLLVGMGVGRLALDRRRVQGALVAAGALLAVLAPLVSSALLARPGLARPLLEATGAPTTDALRDRIARGLYGTTPTDGPWQWLLVVAPHSGTPLDLAATTGSALLVIGACLVVVGALGRLPTRAVAVLLGAGTATLSLYALHVWMRTPGVPPEDAGVQAFRAHVGVVLVLGAVLVASGVRGPLEAAVRWASGGAGRTARRALS
jgi:uncharacterized membrane protein